MEGRAESGRLYQHNNNLKSTNASSSRMETMEVVRDKADLHNLSQDSGLSHSPVQGVQLTIGQPIRHIAERRSPMDEPFRQIGKPVRHLEQAAHLDGQVGNLRRGRKERRWSLGGLNIFKRREREGRGNSVDGGEKPPPLPPKNTNVFQPSLQVRGGEVQPDKTRESENRVVGRVAAHSEVVPPIFPHLRPDLQYPEGGGGRLEEGGYYYDPRFGYVRAGSYYDQQIALMTGVAPDRLSRVSRCCLADTNSCNIPPHFRDSGVSQGRSSGLQSLGSGEGRASSASSLRASEDLRASSSSSLDTTRSWRQDREVAKRVQEEVSSEEEEECKASSQSSRAHSLSRTSQSSSQNSTARRSRTARTERYLARRSKEEVGLVEAQVANIQNPYLHRATCRSLSLEPILQQKAATPPPPPPRDPRRRSYLLPSHSRPVSYSFENLGSADSRRLASPSPQARAPPPLPPRAPCGSTSAHQLQSQATLVNPSRPSSQPPPARGAVHTPSPLPTSIDSPSLTYVDLNPRSRRPVQLRPSPCPSPSPHPNLNMKPEQPSALEFWAPHTNRLEQSTPMLPSPPSSTPLLYSPSPSNLATPSPLPTFEMAPRHQQTPRASAEGPPNEQPNPPPLMKTHSDFTPQHLNEKQSRLEPPPYVDPPTGKLTPTSVTSKDSGCSASSSTDAKLTTENVVETKIDFYLTRPASSMEERLKKEKFQPVVEELATSTPDLEKTKVSTAKRRSHFEEALSELEAVCNDMAKDEDLLDRAERRDLPTVHQMMWRRSEEEEDTEETSQVNTSGETAFSDLDNILNWNTSSSFENVLDLATRARTPTNRRSVVTDKVADDMAVRRVSQANKTPTKSSIALHKQSYLLLSPVLSPATSSVVLEEPSGNDEPDTRTDDLLFRNIRDANLAPVLEPQPKFGLPSPSLGPPGAGATSDYLHAVPAGRYRSTFHPMKNPDVVKDDLAFRVLRKDGNLGDPDTLGIVKDPHGVIQPARVWPPDPKLQREKESRGPVVFYPNRHNLVMQSLSNDIAQIIRKQSCKPGAAESELVNYEEDLLVQDCMRAAREAMKRDKNTTAGSLFKKSPKSSRRRGKWQGKTLYDLLRGDDRRAVSEPETLDAGDVDSEEEQSEDEGVESVLSSSRDEPVLSELSTSPPPSHLHKNCSIEVNSVNLSASIAAPATVEEKTCSPNFESEGGTSDKEETNSNITLQQQPNLPQVVTDNQPKQGYDPGSSDQNMQCEVQSADSEEPGSAIEDRTTSGLPFVLPASISQILSSGHAHDPLHPEAVRNVFLSEQAEESAPQECNTDLTVQACLIDPVPIDLTFSPKTTAMDDLPMDKEKLHAKPSYLTSLVEDWRPQDNSKTLSDGAEWEESTEEGEEEKTLPSDKDPEELARPSVKGRVEGLLEEGKLSGEARLLELIAHPAVGLVAVCFACLRTSTNLDLLTAFGLLLTIVAHLSLLFH